MTQKTSATAKPAGFYCAHHKWLDTHRGPDGLYKVGFTGDLRARLRDDAYVTAYCSGWAFAFVFETRGPKAAERAHLLETAVLHHFRERRLDGRELVEASRSALEAATLAIAGRLKIEGVLRAAPSYPQPPPSRRGKASSENREPSILFGAAERAAVAELAAELAAQCPASSEMESYLSTLLGDDEPAAPAAENVPAAPAAGNVPAALQQAAPGRDVSADVEALRQLPEGDVEEGDMADFIDLGEAARGDDGGDGAPPLEDRAYQTSARDACLAELAATRTPERGGRAILQMACRCGKTLVAYQIIADYLRRPIRALVLVPGLALLRQTAQKFDRYRAAGGVGWERLLLVGSDPRPIVGAKGAIGSMTTEPALIAAALEGEASLLAISTYQSSELLPDGFDLVVFDEAHRVCGGRKPRPFSHVLLTHSRGDRLFMTATPQYDSPLSMKDRKMFGGVAYRYHMREGIDAGFVNDFGLEILGTPDPRAVAKKDAGGGVVQKVGSILSWAFGDDEGPPYTEMTALAAQVIEAMRAVERLLVFCRNIRHAAELKIAVEAVAAYLRRPKVAAALGGEPLPAFACLTAHSRMPRAEANAALGQFCSGGRAALFNCRLFQEGVEIPPLNGIFFAAPRHSPRDIIQSLCRALNALPGKPPSKIFIPMTYNPELDPADPANLKLFASIVPFMDALMSEDPLLYEHLLDPQGTPYPLRWVESRATATGRVKLARYEPDRLLAAARLRVRRGEKGTTERLLKAARVPWAIGFAELERIVRECRRYVKTTDQFSYGSGADAARVNFHNFYTFCRDSYLKWQARELQPLEPHQLRDLRSLPEWETRGLSGPYPWKECLETLDRWLADHGGVPPMLEINKGGFVGLSASPMERLSGWATCINQGDGKDRKGAGPGSGFSIDASKQRDLDALCERWGLRWRKIRKPPPPGAAAGAVGSFIELDAKGGYAGPKTFIQEAHERFKAEWATNKKDSAYINEYYKNYPIKHFRQEHLDVVSNKSAPPRWRKNRTNKPTAKAKPHLLSALRLWGAK